MKSVARKSSSFSVGVVVVGTFRLTSSTFFSTTGMMFHVVMLKAFLAVETEVVASEETTQGIKSVKMFPNFDQDDLLFFRFGGPFENDLIFMIHREYNNLILRKMILELLDLRQTARPFRYSSSTMQFLSFLFLHRETFL